MREEREYDALPPGAHASGLEPGIVRDMQRALMRPEGTLVFNYFLPGLLDPSLGSGIILQIPAGNTLFRLERDAELHLRFIHASPGTGTRISEVDLHELEPTESVRIIVTWSSQEIELYVGLANRPCKPIIGKSYPSNGKTFRVGQNGQVYEIGDKGVQTMGISVFQGGHQVLQDTALESWSSVTETVKLLLANSRGSAGYLLEVAIVNQILVMLVTGFENYCRRRFLEMELEGRAINFERLARRFHSKREVEKGLIEVLKQDATELGKTPTTYMIEKRRIDFQNFDYCKRAYSTGYGISFGRDLGISNQVLEFIQCLIRYRHRIVHVSPMIGMLNQESVPAEDPVFPKVEFGQEALDQISKFIGALHQATLKISATNKQ